MDFARIKHALRLHFSFFALCSGIPQAPRGCLDVLWDAEREFPAAVTAEGVQDGRCMTGGADDVFSYEVNQSDSYGWVPWQHWCHYWLI